MISEESYYTEDLSNDVGLYDFHDAENADGISESSPKNGIYSLTRNVTDCVKVRMNSSKVGHYTFGLVSVNIKPKSGFKYESCMFCASLCEWSRRTVLFAKVTYAACVALVCGLIEDIHI